MQTVRNLRKAFIFIALSGVLAACTNSKPQVEFLKSITDFFLPGAVLKVNGLTTVVSNDTTPTVEISRLSKAVKVELFNSSTCTAGQKLGEVAVTASDTTTTLTLPALSPDGGYEIYALVTFADTGTTECSGNKLTYTLDTVAPGTPTGLSLLTTIHTTATPQIEVQGSESGATVSLYNNAACTGTALGSAVSTGTTVAVTSTAAISEGTHTYYASSKDPAGNISGCSMTSVDYIYDKTPPAIPTVALAMGTVTPNTSNTPSLDISGVISGDTLKIYKDAACASPIQTENIGASAMNVVINPGLSADGTYIFYVRAFDIYDNGSNCSAPTAAYTLDTTPPAAPNMLVLINPGVNPGKSATPRLQVGGVEADDSIQIFSDAACTSVMGSAVAGGSTVLVLSSAVSAGPTTFYANATDPTGNISPCSTVSLTYTYDNVAPTITNVTSSNDNKTYGPGATIVIQLNMSEAVNVNTSGGTPTLTLATLPVLRTATYARLVGGNTLEFEYTVQLGDSAADLNYTSGGLALNGAIVQDLATNNVVTALPQINVTNSLADNKDILITPLPPAVTLNGDPTQRVSETTGTVNLQVSLNYDTYYPITVHLQTYGNAIPGVDYNFSSNTIVIPAGTTTASGAVTLINDAMTNAPRNLMLSLDSATGGVYGGILARFTQKDLHLLDDEVTAIQSQALATGYGASHSCVIKTDGSLYCWGANTYGQLGNNNTLGQSKAVQITTAANALKQISVGNTHSCGIKADDSLWCWGYGGGGELGTGAGSSLIPDIVDAANTYAKVSVGNRTTCAIRKLGGALYCWGDNTNGKLGDGTTVARTLPTLIDTGVSYSDIAVGNNHTCGVTTTGAAKCWGNNLNGQLGDGSSTNRSSPTTVADAGFTYAAITAGSNHSCAITATPVSGALRCWGANSSGQIGDNTTTPRSTPVQAVAAGVSKVVTGSSFTCAMMSDGSLRCWGSNANGQFGNGTTDTLLTPTVTIAAGVSDTSAGDTHTCIISGGDTKCFGNAAYDQLGYGVEAYTKIPTYIESDFASIAQGPTHTCGVTSSGAVRCWGSSVYGAIGDHTTHPRTSPVQIIASGALQVDVGFDFSCAVMSSGQLLCWGNNNGGRLGDGNTSTYRLAPYEVISSGVQKVALGTSHACALKTGGELVCWGDNTYGKVGNNSNTSQSTPVQILASDVTSISVSETHSCAVKAGQLYCWGDNAYGQFGVSSPTNSLLPFATGLNMAQVSAGKSYSCGIDASKKLYCWGANASSQLGDGTTNTSSAAIEIDAGTQYAKVDAYYAHTCGVTVGGTLKCWGSNANYNIGVSPAMGTSSPVSVIASGVNTVTVGYFGTCATMTNTDLKCWGANTNGQVGTGSLEFTRLPLHVLGL